ncbi:TetR/AcrR family transcriptional regulator [Nonomuraea sp. GTA35]|uniref:TetR/AcrR family transcriptional regulator n=1 Tax=Nonomuraea sp. GTA35 TaxID=1676746 RepID=UPI0035C0F36B
MSETPRTRRRPTHRKGRPTLTRESIGQAALTLISRNGPTALTMRILADELGVSPRALYNYVTDQREVLALALSVAQEDAPTPRLDADDWRDSLREYCREPRSWYRRHAGLLALAMSGQFATLTDPQHTLARHQDTVLGFLLELGLSPKDAHRAYQHLILLIAGFTEFYDSWHDRPPAGVDPADWATAAPQVQRAVADLDTPHLSRVLAEAGPQRPDDLFEGTVDMLVAWLERTQRG